MTLTYAHAPSPGGKSTSDSDVVKGRFIEIVPGVRIVQAVILSRTTRWSPER